MKTPIVAPTVRMLCTVAVAVTALAACSHPTAQPLKPKKTTREPITIRKGEDRSILTFNKSVNWQQTKKDTQCSLIPHETAEKMYTKNYEIDVYTAQDERSTRLSCTVTSSKPREDMSLLRLTTLKSPVPVNYKLLAHPLYRPDKKRSEWLQEVTDNHPGVGLMTTHWKAWWTCGNAEIEVTTYDLSTAQDYSNPKRSLWWDNQQLFRGAITALCGTIDEPSKHVTDWPHIVWDRYDAMGGTSPEKYGIPRPTEPANAPYPGQ